MPTLPIERTLGEIILDLLKNDPMSISGITRELQDQGQNLHKLSSGRLMKRTSIQ